MKRDKMLQQLTASVVLSLVVASPVYAAPEQNANATNSTSVTANKADVYESRGNVLVQRSAEEKAKEAERNAKAQEEAAQKAADDAAVAAKYERNNVPTSNSGSTAVEAPAANKDFKPAGVYNSTGSVLVKMTDEEKARAEAKEAKAQEEMKKEEARQEALAEKYKQNQRPMQPSTPAPVVPARDYNPAGVYSTRGNVMVTQTPEEKARAEKKAAENAEKAAKKAAEEGPAVMPPVIPESEKQGTSVVSEQAAKAAEDRMTAAKTRVAPYVGRMVTKINFVGKTTVDPEEVKEGLKLKPGTRLTAEGFDEDLKAMYESGWYYEVDPTFTSVPEGVQINYNVLENPIYTDLQVEGNTKIPTTKIKELFDLPAGKTLNTRKVNEGARKVESEYSKEGYILAKVDDVRMLPDGKLAISVNEGLVEDFKVIGNTKTKTNVVTREMRLKKGEPFNAKDARRSMQRIYNLGFFEDVNIKLNPGQYPNSVVVVISVVEMSTGTFGIGAGYSDADGFIGMISIGDKNLRGTGDSVNLRWEFGGDDENNKNYELSYVHPWLDKRETKLGVTLYDMTNEYVDYNHEADEIARYDKKRRGQEITFSRVTDNDFITNAITLKNRDDSYVKPVDGYRNQYFEGNDRDGTVWGPTVARERQDHNFGNTRSITLARIFDSRDNIFDPRAGKRNSYSVEVANFGGDFNFQKYSVDYRYYYAVGADNVWAWNVAAGYANGDMPLSQRFSVGGSETLRGYKDNQFRGNSMLRSPLEFRMPIVKKVQGVIFTDAGYAWDKYMYDETNFSMGSMKYSIGVGMRINSPLGPLRLDYGFPLRDGNGGRFHFSFGGQF